MALEILHTIIYMYCVGECCVECEQSVSVIMKYETTLEFLHVSSLLLSEPNNMPANNMPIKLHLTSCCMLVCTHDCTM